MHWSKDGWATAQDLLARDNRLGLFVADLPTESLAEGAKVEFTFYWVGDDSWEDQNFEVDVVEA
jgi:glucoamylase